jgi:hypothetical protein
MTDFTPNPDRAATHASNALRSLEDLKQILLADYARDDIKISLLELAIAELKASRYYCNGETTGMIALQIVPSSNLEGGNNG